MKQDDAAIRAEELLRDSRWIQSIARSLFFDPHAADDLVQETWIAAVAEQDTPQDETGSPRPWLARVLRNLAAKCRRADARRAARERFTARDEALASTADLVARAETQRLVVEAVLALDEPFRGAVLRAYIEGQTSVEIARALGVSDATVRSRIRRGLSQLRFELERRRGREWLGACIGLLAASDRSTVLAAWQAASATSAAGSGIKLATAGAVTLLVAGGSAATWTRLASIADEAPVLALADGAFQPERELTEPPPPETSVETATVDFSGAALVPPVANFDSRGKISRAMRDALGDRIVDELAIDDWAEKQLAEVERSAGNGPGLAIAAFQTTTAFELPITTVDARVFVIDTKRARSTSDPNASPPR